MFRVEVFNRLGFVNLRRRNKGSSSSSDSLSSFVGSLSSGTR
ncbi:unnamed protein product, partial [Rotaria socialis]